MKMESKVKKSPHRTEHGTTSSYIIGFILSLIFTIIPYVLVVNKTLSGTVLVVTILGIAVVQMAIQLLFFLHLGRGPKPFYNIAFFFATAGIIILTIGASLFIMANLYHNMLPEEITRKLAQDEGIAQIGGEDTGACSEIFDNHIVTIENNKISPVHTKAKRCDSLTFINKDDIERSMKFGPHEGHESYGGLYEIDLDDKRPETITLNQAGDFEFHDHRNVTIYGHLSVEP
jgi:cytochrome o ubiquinol oxidase subunit IV